jgi:hypothetical protein
MLLGCTIGAYFVDSFVLRIGVGNGILVSFQSRFQCLQVCFRRLRAIRSPLQHAVWELGLANALSQFLGSPSKGSAPVHVDSTIPFALSIY